MGEVTGWRPRRWQKIHMGNKSKVHIYNMDHCKIWFEHRKDIYTKIISFYVWVLQVVTSFSKYNLTLLRMYINFVYKNIFILFSCVEMVQIYSSIYSVKTNYDFISGKHPLPLSLEGPSWLLPSSFWSKSGSSMEKMKNSDLDTSSCSCLDLSYVRR